MDYAIFYILVGTYQWQVLYQTPSKLGIYIRVSIYLYLVICPIMVFSCTASLIVFTQYTYLPVIGHFLAPATECMNPLHFLSTKLDGLIKIFTTTTIWEINLISGFKAETWIIRRRNPIKIESRKKRKKRRRRWISKF